MVDLLTFISENKDYDNLKTQNAKFLVEKHSNASYSELAPMWNYINDECDKNNCDLNKLYYACLANTQIYLPVVPSPNAPQETLFGPEIANSCIDILSYVSKTYSKELPEANKRVASKISECINNCENVQNLAIWVQIGNKCSNLLEVDVTNVQTLASIKAKSGLYQNAISADKDQIIANLVAVVSLEEQKVDILTIKELIVGYALNWIEKRNDISGQKAYEGHPVEPDLDGAKEILGLINKLSITDELLKPRIENLVAKYQFVYDSEPESTIASTASSEFVRPINPAEATPQLVVPPNTYYIQSKDQVTIIKDLLRPTKDVGIYQGKINYNGQEVIVAVKKYATYTQKQYDRCAQEASILAGLSGTGIYFLNFYGFYVDQEEDDGVMKQCAHIVMEYCPYNLQEYLKMRKESGNPLNEQELKHLCTSLLEAFRQLEVNKIYHHDIKPENILLQKNGALKIVDFNISGILQFNESSISSILPNEYNVAGTPNYMAPEVYDAYSREEKKLRFKAGKADVYSLGLVFYLCATGKSIIGMNTDKNSRERVKNDINIEWLSILIYDMLDHDSSARPAFRRSLKYVKGLDTVAQND